MPKTNDPAPAMQFDKATLLASARYADRRDILAALLEDDEQYTFAQVDAALQNFMKGAV